MEKTVITIDMDKASLSNLPRQRACSSRLGGA